MLTVAPPPCGALGMPTLALAALHVLPPKK
jgi:hypothetical protein